MPAPDIVCIVAAVYAFTLLVRAGTAVMLSSVSLLLLYYYLMYPLFPGSFLIVVSALLCALSSVRAQRWYILSIQH